MDCTLQKLAVESKGWFMGPIATVQGKKAKETYFYGVFYPNQSYVGKWGLPGSVWLLCLNIGLHLTWVWPQSFQGSVGCELSTYRTTSRYSSWAIDVRRGWGRGSTWSLRLEFMTMLPPHKGIMNWGAGGKWYLRTAEYSKECTQL